MKNVKPKADKTNLELIIAEKLGKLPPGFNPADLEKKLRETQNVSLTERSVDDFLKIFKSDESSIIDRMSVLDNERLEDDYNFKIINTCFYQYFANEAEKDYYSDIAKHVKRSYVSLDGMGLRIYENITAGRMAGDVGLFRGIFNSLTGKLFDNKKEVL